MAPHLSPTSTHPPSAVTCSTHPNLSTFLPPQFPPFPNTFLPRSFFSFTYTHTKPPSPSPPSSASTFDLLLLSLHQPNFLSSSSTVAFSHHPRLPGFLLPSSLLTSCWHNPQRHGKGGHLCHNMGSHFIAAASGLPGCTIDGLGVFRWPREELRRADSLY